MNPIVKRMLGAVLAGLLALSSSGCGAAAAPAEGYLALTNSPSTTLNNVWYNTGGIFRCAVFDSLVSTAADMKTLRPALAEDYAVSDDSLTYTFTLRQNVTWHDGEKLDAADVLFSLKALLRSREVNGILTSAFQYIEGAQAYAEGTTEEISGCTIQGNTISLRLVSPAGGFLEAVAQFAILPEHLLGAVAPENLEASDYWNRPIGCGPYRIADGAAGDFFLLERNTAYYGKKPGIKRIRLDLSVEDPVSAMEEGTLDFYVTNDPEEIAKLKGAGGCSWHRLNVLFPAYLIFNLSEDPGVKENLKDVRVRRALLMAIDRDAIVEAIFPGSSVSDTMVPAWDSWYFAEGEDYPFDPQGAKALLEEAGFDFSQTIRLRYFTQGQSTADLMGAIAVYWRAIGIQVELQRFEGSGSQHMFQTRDFDVCYKRLSAFNHGAIYEEMAGSGVMQTSLYNLPVYDDLIEQLDIADDEPGRKALVDQMQRLDQAYLLRLPLFSLVNVAFVNETHFEMPEAYGNLWYRYDLRFEDWRLVSQ